MNIKPMLMRLQNAISRNDLIEQMVLFTPKTSFSQEDKAGKSVNLIVGYNSSPKSHTALDLGLLIAHQTRLATKAQVTVQVVYVLEDYESSDYADVLSREKFFSNREINQIQFSSASTRFATPILTETTLQANQALKETSVNKFANAERILRQAVCLAEEWKSPFKAHLRFGCVATQLQKVVESEAAELLLLGCNSAKHPIVQKLDANFPATVLGIPCVGEHCLGGDSGNCGYFV